MLIFRRKLFIYPEVQKPFLIQILLGTLLISIIQSFLIFAALKWMAYQAQVDISIIIDYRVLKVWKYSLYLAIFIPLIFNVIVGMYLLLFFSNKFAGPLFRLERELDRYISGEISDVSVQFRQNDYLRGLAAKVNQVMEIKNKRTQF